MREADETHVRLRPLAPGDVDALVAGRGDPDPEADRARLHRQLERNPTLQDGGFLQLAIEAGGRIVGDVQARAPANGFPPGVCEIGIDLFPDARGRGYGREAVILFTRLLHDEGWERVQASTALDNRAMRRVLELAGYEYEGVLRSFAPDEGGGRADYALYAAIRPG